MLLALLTDHGSSNLVGRAGAFINGGLTYAVGDYVAYIVPLLVLVTAIQVWRGRGMRRAGIRIIGLYGVIASACALLAIPYARVDFNALDGFRAGGALGNYLVHTKCLNLAGLLGNVGVYLMFIALLVVSLSTATDVRIRDFLIFAKGIVLRLADGNLTEFFGNVAGR